MMVDRCVICGEPVPEGWQVCWSCIEKTMGRPDRVAEIGDCEGCAYSHRKRPQKCSCCRRNPDMKDCYERGE